MSDLISRQAALDAIHCNITVTGRQNAELVAATIGAFADRIKALPTVQPKHGKWIERESDTEDKENGFETVIVCSRCGYPATTFYSEDCESRTQIRTAFCPNCGADMRGDEKRDGKKHL